MLSQRTAGSPITWSDFRRLWLMTTHRTVQIIVMMRPVRRNLLTNVQKPNQHQHPARESAHTWIRRQKLSKDTKINTTLHMPRGKAWMPRCARNKALSWNKRLLMRRRLPKKVIKTRLSCAPLNVQSKNLGFNVSRVKITSTWKTFTNTFPTPRGEINR